MRRALTAWWFAPAPAERLAALRILAGAYATIYMVARLPELVAVTRLPRTSFAPLGVVRVLDAPLPAALVIALAIATIVLGIAFTLGVAYRATAPAFAVLLVWTLSYRTSWGQTFHTENLLALHVIVLALAPAADVWAIRARPRAGDAGYGWAVKLLVAVTAATYLLAGIAKLRLAGVAWLDGVELRNQIAIDNARKALLGDPIGVLARPVVAHPAALAAFSIATLAVELGAPIVLAGGVIGRAWAVAAWLFHIGVVLAMNIMFPYALFGFAFLPLFPVERPLGRIAAWNARRRDAG